MNPFSFFTFTDDAGRWHWQRSGRYANPEGAGYATRELATDAARRRHRLEIIHQGEELERQARGAYPRNLTAQEHYRRGYIVACGDDTWQLVGSVAEADGARQAQDDGRAGSLPPTPRDRHLAAGRAQLEELEAELCGCGECLALDKRHPREGAQLALPGTHRAPVAAQEVLL